ncbi:hypothetical protein NL108_002499 [Boleophthalmus pectinirostris]|nr:hypothetical protein NL108_002499 [Boleophthalmus pectinirostris]
MHLLFVNKKKNLYNCLVVLYSLLRIFTKKKKKKSSWRLNCTFHLKLAIAYIHGVCALKKKKAYIWFYFKQRSSHCATLIIFLINFDLMGILRQFLLCNE